MNAFLIVADDFTGANDTGVQIRKRGIPTKVLLDGKGIRADGSSYVLDTESRNVPAQEAYNMVAQQVKDISWEGYSCVIKKVDSTLRGNIARETQALDEAFQPEIIVFAPAFPEIGRTTVGGIHMLDGKPISQTEIAKDPKKPVHVDHLAGILQEVYQEPIAEWDLERLQQGGSAPNARIICFDASAPEDLGRIVQTVMGWNKKVLWIGCAGLANALLNAMASPAPVLAVVGSVSERSREQVLYCEKQGKEIVRVDVGELLEKGSASAYRDRVITCLDSGRDTVLCTAYTRADYDRAVSAGEAQGMTKEQVSDFTQQFLAELVLEVARSAGNDLKGLFLTGGDTAIGLMVRSGAFGSTIAGEVELGIPWSRIDGGILDGMPIITKAGAFGNEQTLCHCLEKLKEI